MDNIIPELKIEPEKRYIGESRFLGGNNGVKYRIPEYQRKYTWNRDEWEDILTDLEESIRNTESHFFGTFVFVNNDNNNVNNPEPIEIVDGQQRITTISLLYLSLIRILTEYYIVYHKISLNNQYNSDIKNRITTEIQYIRDKIKYISKCIYFIDDDEDTENKVPEIKLELSKCSRNNESYNKLCTEVYTFYKNRNNDDTNLIYSEWEERINIKGLLIYKCFKYFYNNLSNNFNKKAKELKLSNYIIDENNFTKLSDEISDNYKNIKDIYKMLRDGWVSFIIKTDNNSTACRLFDSLNNRGIPLSSVDIIKNKIFTYLLEKNSNNNSFDNEKRKLLDAYQDKWVEITNNVLPQNSSSDKLLKRFFVDYYNNKYNKTNIINDFVNESTLISYYDNILRDTDVKILYDDLVTKSKYYHDIACSTNNDKEKKDRQIYLYPLTALNSISALPSYVVLYYLYDKFQLNDLIGSKKAQLYSEIVIYISEFFAVRHILDFPKVKHLPELFLYLLLDLRKIDGNIKSINEFRDIFLKHITNDDKPNHRLKIDDLYSSLKELEYEEGITRISVIKFLYTLYENKIKQSSEGYGTAKKPYELFWSDDRKKKYSIEHIVPKGNIKDENNRNSWKNDLNGGDDKCNDYDNRKEFVNKLGNLILVELNSEISQLPFKQKVEKYYKKLTHLAMYNEIKNKNKWNREEITIRTENLSKILYKYLREDLYGDTVNIDELK